MCTFKYDFHVKIMLQTSQVVLTSSFVPIPPFSPPCSTLPSMFLSETKANYIKSNLKIWNKTIFSPFAQIWKIHLNPFLLWLLLLCSLCPSNVNWPVCAQHSCHKSDDDIHIRFRFARICQVFTFNFLVSQSISRLYCWLSQIRRDLKIIYNLVIDLID